MRNRTWLTLAFIIVLAVVSGWVSLPSSAFDIAGFRASHPIREGLDLQGGLQVVLQARPVAGQTIDKNTLEGTRRTLDRRVNGLGVSEPMIQTRGNDQIIVELPGVADPQEAIGILQQTALLEIIDPLGQYLPPGTLVNTTLGPASDALGIKPPTPPRLLPEPQSRHRTPQPLPRPPRRPRALAPALRTGRSTKQSLAGLNSRMPTSRLAIRASVGWSHSNCRATPRVSFSNTQVATWVSPCRLSSTSR